MTDPLVACPVLVPLLSLGRQVMCHLITCHNHMVCHQSRCFPAWQVIALEGSSSHVGTFSITATGGAVGGQQLRTTCLTEELFAASAMKVVPKSLMEMKVADLKDELEARGEPKSGNKAWLRRRLHAAIVLAHVSGDEDE